VTPMVEYFHTFEFSLNMLVMSCVSVGQWKDARRNTLLLQTSDIDRSFLLVLFVGILFRSVLLRGSHRHLFRRS